MLAKGGWPSVANQSWMLEGDESESWTGIAEPENHMVEEAESSSAGWMIRTVEVRAVGYQIDIDAETGPTVVPGAWEQGYCCKDSALHPLCYLLNRLWTVMTELASKKTHVPFYQNHPYHHLHGGAVNGLVHLNVIRKGELRTSLVLALVHWGHRTPLVVIIPLGLT